MIGSLLSLLLVSLGQHTFPSPTPPMTLSGVVFPFVSMILELYMAGL